MVGQLQVIENAIVVAPGLCESETIALATKIIEFAYSKIMHKTANKFTTQQAGIAFFEECLSQLESDEQGEIPFTHLNSWISGFESGFFGSSSLLPH